VAAARVERVDGAAHPAGVDPGKAAVAAPGAGTAKLMAELSQWTRAAGRGPAVPAPGERERTRLPVQTVERLHRLLGGDVRVEEMIVRFIADRYGARSLIHLPPHVAKEILKRPADFIQAAKQHCEPELQF
jgi:hypothetical protein